MNSRTAQPPSHLPPQEARKPQRKPSLNPTLRFSRLCGVHLLGFIFYLSSFILSSSAPPPELTILRQQYDKVVAERVTVPFDASKAALDTKFAAALDNAISTAKGAGELKTVLALEAEKKRLADKLPLPAEDSAAPEALQKLRVIYQEQLAKLEEARTANHAALLPAYTAKLAALEVTLTKADRVAEAAEVLTYREGLAAGKTETQAATASPTTIATSTTGTKPATTTKAPQLTKAEKAANTQRLTGWALANGHAVIVILNGKEQRIEPGAAMPAGESTLIAIHRIPSVPDVKDPPPWDAFAGQEELRQLFLADWKSAVGSGGLSALAYLPSLTSLELNFTAEASAVEALPELPQLRVLKFKPRTALLGAEIAALVRKTPALTEVLLDRVEVSDEEFTALKGWKSLVSLVLAGEATPLSKAKCDTLAAMTKLEKIMFYGCRPNALSVEAMTKLKNLTKLQFNYNVSPENLQAAMALTKLNFIGFSDISTLSDADLEAISKAPAITEVRIRNSPKITDAGLAHLLKLTGITELEIQRCPGITAAAYQSLSVLKPLRSLVVHQTTFDDAALASLTRSRALKELGCNKTAVTDTGLKTFQKARPDIQIDR